MLRTVSKTWPTSAEDPPDYVLYAGDGFCCNIFLSLLLPKHFLLRAKPFTAVTPLRSEFCPFVLSAFSGRPFAAETHQAPRQLTLNAVLLFFLMQCAVKLLHLFEVYTMLLFCFIIRHGLQGCTVSVVCWLDGSPMGHFFLSNQTWIPRI